MPRSSIPLSFDIGLPPGPGPVSSRLATEIVRAIALGQLREADPLPSTRTLASETGIARSTVVAAYEELSAGGFVVSRPGSMTSVAPGAADAAKAGVHPSGPERSTTRPQPTRSGATLPLYDLTPGLPDAGLINATAWSRAWRRAERRAREAEPVALERSGADRRSSQLLLREHLCTHLRRNRGVVCSPDDIFLFPSPHSVLPAIVEALDLAGGDAAVEDPGSPIIHAALTDAGCSVRPCAVDDQGLAVEELRGDESVVYATPSHQVPLGVGMSPLRRRDLLVHAARTGAVVVEDDVDGQFCDADPATLPLRSMEGAEDTVIHLGTAARLISPQLRTAWAVVPQRLRRRFDEERRRRGHQVCGVAADALTEFIASGAFTRHIVASRRVYGHRRRSFLDACRARLPGLELSGGQSGLRAVIMLDAALSDTEVTTLLRRRGLVCLPLSPSYAPGSPRRSGLVCGHGRLRGELSSPAVRVIADVLT